MRIVVSLALLAVLITMTHGWRRIGDLITRPGRIRRLALLAAAAAMTAVNWGLFIWATTNGLVVDASLGYFITPLFMVLLGVTVFGERLSVGQWVALGLAAAAVVVLIVGYGQVPWIALTLAATFGVYGLIKKALNIAAVEAMFLETLVLFVPALVYVVALQNSGAATFGHEGAAHALLVVGACGVMLAPMLLFSSAANVVRLSVVGMLQYIEPVIQFLIGLVVFRELVDGARWSAFALVWTALLVLAVSGVRGGPMGDLAFWRLRAKRLLAERVGSDVTRRGLARAG